MNSSMCHMMIFFTTLIFAKISFVGPRLKILRTQKFRAKIRSFKKPWTHVWKQCLILNLKVHFRNYLCCFQLATKSAQNFRYRQKFLLESERGNFYEKPANDFQKPMYSILNTQEQKNVHNLSKNAFYIASNM